MNQLIETRRNVIDQVEVTSEGSGCRKRARPPPRCHILASRMKKAHKKVSNQTEELQRLQEAGAAPAKVPTMRVGPLFVASAECLPHKLSNPHPAHNALRNPAVICSVGAFHCTPHGFHQNIYIYTKCNLVSLGFICRSSYHWTRRRCGRLTCSPSSHNTDAAMKLHPTSGKSNCITGRCVTGQGGAPKSRHSARLLRAAGTLTLQHSPGNALTCWRNNCLVHHPCYT